MQSNSADQYDKFFRIYVGSLIAVSLLPIVAPVLLKISETVTFLQLPAQFIYLIYSFTCHQFGYRSFAVFDYQFAWCARDTGIWLGMAFTALLSKRIKPLPWYWLPVFILPIALDGGIQTIATLLGVPIVGETGAPIYISNNLVRFITGAWFGIGISMWISPYLAGNTDANVVHARKLESNPNLLVSHKKFILGALAIIPIVYICIIGVWNLTSLTNKPIDLLDSAVKTPAVDFYTRRLNGPCPAGIEDFTQLECLLNVK